MAKKIVKKSDSKRRPALSPESRDNQLISDVYDLVEQRIHDGTASAAETTHFLKLATKKNMLEVELLEEQRKLAQAKTEALQSAKRVEALYADALNAMRRYSGQGGPKSDDEEDEYEDY